MIIHFLSSVLRILYASPTMVDCVTEETLEVLPHNNLVPRRDRKAWKDGFDSVSTLNSIYGVANRPVTKVELGHLENVLRVVSVLEKLVEIIKEITGKEKIR